MPELIKPTVEMHAAWIEARDEWGRGVHQDGGGLRPEDEVDTPEGFAAWVAKLHREADPAVPPVEGWVHCSYRWMVEDGRMLGSIALRHELNELLLNAGGHIGYSVRPSERRRGRASWALGEMLGEAWGRGIDPVLVCCTVTNEASAGTIEKRGGVLEDIRETDGVGVMKRYWITR
ncbi:GNAT family N-acetyltransferase [Actinoplanes sp. NPDC051851]|uniref:GNAT family N-acetyltransferase n=1 Tax=Actinoplanes sp. NPDC051851 TaxID=3154753 RepID=UPI003419CA2B